MTAPDTAHRRRGLARRPIRLLASRKPTRPAETRATSGSAVVPGRPRTSGRASTTARPTTSEHAQQEQQARPARLGSCQQRWASCDRHGLTLLPQPTTPRPATSCSPKRAPGPHDVGAHVVLGEAVQQGPHGSLERLRAGESAGWSPSGRSGAWCTRCASGSMRQATGAMPGRAVAASGRTQDGSSDGVTTRTTMPRRTRPALSSSISDERRRPLRLRHGQEAQDLVPLADAAVDGDDGPAQADGLHAHAAAIGEGVAGASGSRDARRRSRRWRSRRMPTWTPRCEVEEDPQVGRGLDVELLDLQLLVTGARAPVDAIEGVARGVGTHARHDRREHAGPARPRADAPRWPPAAGSRRAGRATCG